MLRHHGEYASVGNVTDVTEASGKSKFICEYKNKNNTHYNYEWFSYKIVCPPLIVHSFNYLWYSQHTHTDAKQK